MTSLGVKGVTKSTKETSEVMKEDESKPLLRKPGI